LRRVRATPLGKELDVLNRRDMLLTGAALLAAPAAFARPRKAVREVPKAAAKKDAPKAAGADDEEGGQDFSAASGPPAQTPMGPMDTVAQWAYIEDFNTGAVLMDKQADVEMPPSSMTKLMTAYIVYSKLKAGSLHLDQMLPVSEHAWRTQGSKMFVEINGTIKVEDLIRGMIIQSGNDACIVLAEGIAGTEEQFVELMNDEAKKLGLTHSVFRNCTGWPDPEHHMSVHDIAKLAKAIIRDFPEYYHYDSEKQYTYHGIVQYNRNPLVQKGLADGLKTGHTDAGGYGLVASAERNGRRVIMVLNGMPSKSARVQESLRLLEWSFANFENVTLLSAADVAERAPVYLGAMPSVPLVAGRDVVLTMPRSWRQHARVVIDYDGPVPAPVNRGDVIGQLSVSGQGVPETKVPLLAGEDVPRMGIMGRAAAVLSHYATGA
jgi:serine-type D-Ala-D-Ala carboxypeptidase (penicillin-binding protein 5/6)